jgi:hypothetical protein
MAVKIKYLSGTTLGVAQLPNSSSITARWQYRRPPGLPTPIQFHHIDQRLAIPLVGL